MCYRRLRVLSGNEKSKKKKIGPLIKRERLPFSDEYFYWPAGRRRPDQVQHRLGVNWLYVWFHYWATRMEAKLYFKAEPKEYGQALRPDAFAALQDAKQQQLLFFGEFNRHESGNDFDKIPKYTALFERIVKEKAQGIKSHWWIDPFKDQKIPYLTIITTGPTERLRDRIQKENRLGIPIDLKTLDDLKGRCLEWAQQQSKSLAPASPDSSSP